MTPNGRRQNVRRGHADVLAVGVSQRRTYVLDSYAHARSPTRARLQERELAAKVKLASEGGTYYVTAGVGS